MDLSSLPEPLRQKVERGLRSKPSYASLVARLLTQRSAATTDAERARIDQTLERLVSPSRWALVLALAIFSFAGAIAAYFLYRGHQIERAVASGTPTTAQVERLERGDCAVGTKTDRCLQLTVKLYPTSGAPYVASLTQLIPLEFSSRVQPGSWLTLAVDPTNPQNVTFDVRTMSVPPPSPAR